MEFRVLGSVEVERDGVAVDLGAYRQRALLALLLTQPNSVFTTDQIIDGLWGEDAGGDKQNALWVYVSGLRKALEPEREKRTDGTVLLTRAPGYLVEVDPDALDSARFERLVNEGRLLLDRDPAAASIVLNEALELWRGRPFEDFTYESFAQAQIRRLEELRIEAVSTRIDADLACGRSRALVSELESLVRQHPLREEFTSQLMLALYRSGRQAEALRRYTSLRSRLVEELGIDPSVSVQRLHDRMLAADETLGEQRATQASPDPTSGLTVRGYELREQIGSSEFGVAYRAYQPAVGREVAIKIIRPELANNPAFIRRFEAEAQLVAQLEHPHIVPLYDFWREPDAAYLVMRWMKGGTLAQRLTQGALTADQAATVADQLAGALQTAHRKGVPHRDIKPSNVLIDENHNAYLADFGIAVSDGDRSAENVEALSLSAPYASPEQLAGDPTDEASDVYSLGVVIGQAVTGLHGDVDQIRGAIPTAARAVIDRATATAAEERLDLATFASDLRSALVAIPSNTDRAQASSPVDLVNPYKGLRAFDGTDAADFFGRDRLVERLVAQLGSPGARGRFLAVVGPSGSGKSSVVKAGLLPAIRHGAAPNSDRWFVAEMTPAPHPFESLEDALLGVAVEPPASLLEQLVGSKTGLQHALDAALPDDGTQLLLVIDQSEELFTQVSPSVTKRFLDMLVQAVTAEHSRLHVVVTLRADFYDRPLSHSGIGQLLDTSTQVITPMTPDQLERAIAGPVEPLGVTFEPALVAELVHEVADRAGALPLLQYTLTELFDRRQGARITMETYRELGGVSGALVQRAEGLLAGLGDSSGDVARQVFLRLVSVAESDGGSDTRRRALRSELEGLGLDRTALRDVLETFGRHRLLSFDRDPVTRGPTVEISHEALLSEWTRLRDWIEAARDDVRNQRRLAEAVGEWQRSNRSNGYLLRGGHLDQLDGWARETTLTLSIAERELLDESIATRDRDAHERAESKQRVVEAEREATVRRRQLVGASVLGVLVAGLAIFGISQWLSASDARDEASGARTEAESARDEAETERERAVAARDEADMERAEAIEARASAEAALDANESLIAADQFRSASNAALTTDPTLALLLAVEAVRSTADQGFAAEEAIDSLHWALQQLSVPYPVGADAPTTLRSGPTGLTGVFLLPPAELVALAEAATDRRLTDAECVQATGNECPQATPIDVDLPLRFGEENYTVNIPEVLPNVPAFGDGPLAGTRVTIAMAATTGLTVGLEAELARFTDTTGIEVELVSNASQDLTRLLATGELVSTPDIVGFWTDPPPWAEERTADVSHYLEVDVLRSDFGNYIVDQATTDAGKLESVVMQTTPGSLVLYRKPLFDAAGYDIPESWDELIELSDEMIADGLEPWCFDWGAGFASGFAGSDFLDSLVLRVAGADVYDSWASGEVRFDDPAIVEAAERASELIFTPGYVAGGSGQISTNNWAGSGVRLLDGNPRSDALVGPPCAMAHQTAQHFDLLGDADSPGGGELGVDVDYFILPPVAPGQPAAMASGIIRATPLSDRPEVRALITHIASPSWGELWAGTDSTGETFISSNQRFNPAAYRGVRSQEHFAVRVRLHEDNRAGIEDGSWRIGASDLMPVEFASWTNDYVPGPYWQGMLDWANQVKPIDEILADIQAAREQFDAE